MRIIRMEAENIKRLRCVSITPQGNVVEIAGNNEQGKSSVLDAIWMALGGGSALPEVPVRKGAEKGRVKLDLGELVVERRFNHRGGTELRVESRDGTRLKSPQAVLDELTGALTFDPLAFSRMTPKAQLEQLRAIVRLEEDIDKLDAENARDYEARTDVNREIKSLEAQAGAITIPPDTPDEEIDEAALTADLREVGEFNAGVARLKALRDAKHAEAKRMYQQLDYTEKRVLECDREITNLRNAITVAEHNKADFQLAAEKQKREADAMVTDAENIAQPELKSTDALMTRIATARNVNRQVEMKRHREEITKLAADKHAEAAAITRRMETRDEHRRAIIEAAKMPVDGLSFGDNQVIYRGIPFSQASAAVKLRVSTAIAIAENPKLRVIRIEDGSLLDADSMGMLCAMAEEHDMQIWIERVTASGPSAIVMEDGQVATAARAE